MRDAHNSVNSPCKTPLCSQMPERYLGAWFLRVPNTPRKPTSHIFCAKHLSPVCLLFRFMPCLSAPGGVRISTCSALHPVALSLPVLLAKSIVALITPNLALHNWDSTINLRLCSSFSESKLSVQLVDILSTYCIIVGGIFWFFFLTRRDYPYLVPRTRLFFILVRAERVRGTDRLYIAFCTRQYESRTCFPSAH